MSLANPNTIARSEFETAFNMAIGNNFTDPDGILFAEMKYAEYIKALKKEFQTLHKSLIFMKKFMKPQVFQDNKLELVNDSIEAYTNNPTDATAISVLETVFNGNACFYQEYERKIEYIDPTLFYNNNPTEKMRRILETPEINSGDNIYLDPVDTA